jgi:hypothetical protein
MKINWTDYDLTDFLVKEDLFCGIPARLIQPNHIATKFTQKNKIFRSSIWTLDGELLSASFYKFVNLGENPDNFPPPTNLNNCQLLEKIDGSACIIDYINNKISMRTRGTFSYEGMENKADFDLCLSQCPHLEEWLKYNPQYSIICEITTPNLKIILDYGDTPKFWLVGIVDKNTYSLLWQDTLDSLAKQLGISRPPHYSFEDIDSLISNVEQWKGKEGLCLYSSNGQEIHKMKSDWYRRLHAAKENFRNIDAVIDAWFVLGKPEYQKFVDSLTQQYDYETMLICQGYISKICDAWEEVQEIQSGIDKFVENVLFPLPTRKEQAEKVLSSYSKSSRASMVFKRLDKKPWMDDDLKKLLYQCLKK